MEVIHKSCLNAELFLLIDSKTADQPFRDKRTRVITTVDSPEVSVSKEAGQPQRIARRLARKSDYRVAEKVRQFKEIIAKGEYQVDPREVAKSIIHSEISRQLERSKVRSIHMDLTELLTLTEEEIVAQCEGVREARRIVGPRRASQTNRSSTKSNLGDCLR
jgi:flagellar biosynthesis anti-sigma factor FlgM